MVIFAVWHYSSKSSIYLLRMLFIATVGRYVRRPLATIRRLVPKVRPAGPVATRVPIVGTLRLRNVATVLYSTGTVLYSYSTRTSPGTSSCKVIK